MRIITIANVDINIIISKLKIVRKIDGISIYDMKKFDAMIKRMPPHSKELSEQLEEVLKDLGYKRQPKQLSPSVSIMETDYSEISPWPESL